MTVFALQYDGMNCSDVCLFVTDTKRFPTGREVL